MSMKRHSFTSPAWPTPMSMVAATAWRTTTKRTLPAFSSSIRLDDSIEFSTAPHVVQYVSNRLTRLRRRSIARIFSVGSLHSRHTRPFTSDDSMLPRTNDVSMGCRRRSAALMRSRSGSPCRCPNFRLVAEMGVVAADVDV